MALVARLGLAGVGQRSLATRTLRIVKFWRVPSNAAPGTAGRMIVFNTGSPANVVTAEGVVTADSGGQFDLTVNESAAAGTKTLAVVHAWNGVTGTSSIYGGPGIATLNEVPA
jgi:hypothetical protein